MNHLGALGCFGALRTPSNSLVSYSSRRPKKKKKTKDLWTLIRRTNVIEPVLLSATPREDHDKLSIYQGPT